MSERNLKEQDLEKVIVDLTEQDLTRAEIGRRLGISRYRIGRVAAAHGSPDARTHTARRRDGRTLSKRQTRMLAFISDYTAANSYPPSLRGCVRSLGYVLEWRHETQSIPQ